MIFPLCTLKINFIIKLSPLLNTKINSTHYIELVSIDRNDELPLKWKNTYLKSFSQMLIWSSMCVNFHSDKVVIRMRTKARSRVGVTFVRMKKKKQQNIMIEILNWSSEMTYFVFEILKWFIRIDIQIVQLSMEAECSYFYIFLFSWIIFSLPYVDCWTTEIHINIEVFQVSTNYHFQLACFSLLFTLAFC